MERIRCWRGLTKRMRSIISDISDRIGKRKDHALLTESHVAERPVSADTKFPIESVQVEKSPFFADSLGPFMPIHIPKNNPKPEVVQNRSNEVRIPAYVYQAYSKLTEPEKAEFRKLLPEILQERERLFDSLRFDPEKRNVEEKKYHVPLLQKASANVFPLLKRVADELLGSVIRAHNKRVFDQTGENAQLQ